MSKKILVTYASQAGSTAGVAEAIARSLASTGSAVDLRPVAEVTDLTAYQAVVIGSAVHSGKCLPEVEEFVRRNRAGLRQIPTAIFQVCMMLASANQQYRSMVPTWLDPFRAELNPVSTCSFAGAVILDDYPKFTDKLGMKIFLASIKLKEGDYRDWNAIQAWSDQLHPLLLK